jgi:3-dehydroquinate dehydratase type I
VRRAPFGPDPWIVGCVGEPDLLCRCAEAIPDYCDLLEVRIDLLNAGGPDSPIPGTPPPDPVLGLPDDAILDCCRAIAAQGLPILATIRHASQGGKCRDDEDLRRRRYYLFATVAAAIDSELRIPGVPDAADFLRQYKTDTGLHTVGSHHDFRMWPDRDLPELVSLARSANVSVWKLAAEMETRWSVEMGRRHILDCRDAGLRVAIQGMQPYGTICRATFIKTGSCCCYGAVGAELVLGQPTCQWLALHTGRIGPIPRCTQESLNKMVYGF